MAAREKKAEKTEKAEKAEKAKKVEKAKKERDLARGEHDLACDERDLTCDGIIRRYLEIYRRCMTDDPKSFDARGAAHALEQISKLLGLTVSAKDTDGNEIVLTLSEEANALGQ